MSDMTPMGQPLLEVRHLSKNFGPVQALNDLTMMVRAGEVVALAGDNGAGKTTLIKAISGVYQPSSGEILLQGKPVTFGSPQEARDKGIETIYQDLALADNLTIGANIFLGREPMRRKFGFLPVLDRAKMAEAAKSTMALLDFHVSRLDAPVSNFSGGQRQRLAIARAIYKNAPILILDEATSALDTESERAVQLAGQFSASAITLSQVPQQLVDADIVISSTASTLPIVGKGMVEQALKQRKHKPMFLVDLAVPRDIEQQVAELEDAYLYTVDDLQSIVAQNLTNRQQAAEQAKQMISVGVAEFAQWQTLQGNADWVRDYRQRCDTLRNELLAKALNQLASGQDAEKVLAELSVKLTNRLMHSPTKAIRQLVQDDELNKQNMINTLLDL